MEAVLLTAGMAYFATRLKHHVPDLSERHKLYGRPWDRGVNPDLGLNKVYHPQSNLINTYSIAKVPVSARNNYVRNRLRTSTHNVDQRNNHYITKRYTNPSMFEIRGNGVGVSSQHAIRGKHGTGKHIKMGFTEPQTVRVGTMNSGVRKEFAPPLGNSPDWYHGPTHVTGKPEF